MWESEKVLHSLPSREFRGAVGGALGLVDLVVEVPLLRRSWSDVEF